MTDHEFSGFSLLSINYTFFKDRMTINAEEIQQSLCAIFLKSQSDLTFSLLLMMFLECQYTDTCREQPPPRWCLGTFLIGFSFLPCNIFHGANVLKFGDLGLYVFLRQDFAL